MWMWKCVLSVNGMILSVYIFTNISKPLKLILGISLLLMVTVTCTWHPECRSRAYRSEVLTGNQKWVLANLKLSLKCYVICFYQWGFVREGSLSSTYPNNYLTPNPARETTDLNYNLSWEEEDVSLSPSKFLISQVLGFDWNMPWVNRMTGIKNVTILCSLVL